jgi:hypothetical protein
MGWPDETDDEVIDRMWRARYGQPLPVMGSAAIARKILTEWMAEPAAEPAPPVESPETLWERFDESVGAKTPPAVEAGGAGGREWGFTRRHAPGVAGRSDADVNREGRD